MHPMRRIEEIRSTLEDGEVGAAEIRAAAKLLEATTPVGVVLAAVAAKDFLPALIRHSEGCPAPQERAWLTLAAAGTRRARLTLAWRASEALQAAQVVEVFVNHRHDRKEECRRRAAATTEADGGGAWLLLSHLSGRELRRLVRGRPALAGLYRRARAKRPSATLHPSRSGIVPAAPGAGGELGALSVG